MGDPGIVHVYHDEVESIARYLSVEVLSFIEKYLYPIKGGYGIKEHTDGQCYFYQDGCTIYPVRPGQCRTFPFWFENLRSWKKWQQVAKACPGLGSGKFYSKEQILKIINSTFIDHVNNIP
jgi:Fe-S-cluster containining protein